MYPKKKIENTRIRKELYVTTCVCVYFCMCDQET